VLDYLLTRPDWDGKTIVLMGISQGGSRVSCWPDCGPKKFRRSGLCSSRSRSGCRAAWPESGFPNWPSDNPDVMRTALYFDPVNFARHIKAPVLAAFGFIDTVSSPAGIWTALNQIPGPVEPLPMIESEHNNLTPEKEQDWAVRSEEVLETLRRGEEFRPKTMK
jgi:cephalosporin-C deacetylase-like acetyl esterase